MSAWGKTGRVAVEDVSRYVLVDGRIVGYATNDYAECFLYNGDRPWSKASSRDAAVLWVLRRVDPALWRQERGPVWRVKYVSTCAYPWLPVSPDGHTCGYFQRTLPEAINAAARYSGRAATR